jgi:hypothetical protein
VGQLWGRSLQILDTGVGQVYVFPRGSTSLRTQNGPGPGPGPGGFHSTPTCVIRALKMERNNHQINK